MITKLRNYAKSDLARLAARIKRDALRRGWVCLAGVLVLLVAAANPASSAENKGPKTFIPKIANIAGIKIGYSSMEELERRLGKGKVAVGGHPNGARLWRVKGTPWVIHADAFEYSERGAVVDSFDINVDPGPRREVPYARTGKNSFVWLGQISVGMEEDKLLAILKQNSCEPTKVADGWQVKAKGYSPLMSDPIYPLQKWTVQFRIKEKSLAGMQIEARHGPETK